MDKKTYIIPNIHLKSRSYTKDGRTAEELLAQAGDVLKEKNKKIGSSISKNKNNSDRDDITSLNNEFLNFAKNMQNKNGNSSYPGYMPIRKAMYSSPSVSYNGGGNVMSTPPSFYSPIHTPTNWQIPTKRREVYMWMCPIDFTEIVLNDYTVIKVNKIIKNMLFDEITEDILTSGKVFKIKNNQYILSGEGNTKKLVNLFVNKDLQNEYYKFSFYGTNHKIYSHKNHPIYVLSSKVKNNKNIFFESEASNYERIILKKESNEITKDDFGLIPISDFKNNYREYSENFFYLVGCILCSKSLLKDNNDSKSIIKFDVRKKIKNSVIKRLKIIYPNEQIFKSKSNLGKKYISIKIKSKKVFNDFNLFIKGNGNNTKIKIPFTDLSMEQAQWIFWGYFLNVSAKSNKKNKTHKISFFSENLLNQFYFLSLHIGIFANILKTNKKSINYLLIPFSDIKNGYLVFTPINKNKKYFKNSHFYIDKNNKKYFARKIKKIKKFKYDGESFDFEVDQEHSYCISGFKVSNCRFFANNNATINASLRFYSEFPFTNYEHVMTNVVRKEHYDKLKERLKIEQVIPQIAWEFFTMGDAFPFVSIDCPICGGWGKKPDGTTCDHKGGKIGIITILNPDLIDVKANPIDPNSKIISLVPDETLISIVTSKSPKEIYKMIPDNVKRMISLKQPIPLNSKSVFHLKHRDVPYITYGMSLLAPLFPTLAYLDRLRQAQWIVAERHILPIKICKVGNDQRPAGPQDIADVRNQLAATANDPNLTLVVHHAFCHDIDTEVLTENGWKKYYEVNDDEKIMIFDQNTEEMYFDNFTQKYEFNYNGRMICFKNDNVDICVTPNHSMLYQEKESKKWKVDIADDVRKKNTRNFRVIGDWKSDSDFPKNIIMSFDQKIKTHYGEPDLIKDISIPINIFLKLVGYYLSDGSLQFSETNRKYEILFFENTNKLFYNKISQFIADFADSINSELQKNIIINDDKNKINIFKIKNKVLSFYFKNNFGTNYKNKKIPKWIKNLPKNKLKILLNAFASGIQNSKEKSYLIFYKYSCLLEDISEIAYKCGYVLKGFNGNDKNTKFKFKISFKNQNIFPTVKKKQISQKSYSGLVWCFGTKTGFFVTRRNGKITIQHNSFEWVGSCYTEKIEVMTKRGFLQYNQVTKEDQIATYNSKTKKIEYHKYIKRFEYDYDSKINGKIKTFKNKFCDIEVTKNHKMYAKTEKSDFQLIKAEKIKENNIFLGYAGWDGNIPTNIPFKKNSLLQNLSLDEFLTLSAYFISSGAYGVFDKKIGSINISRKINSKTYLKTIKIVKKIKKPNIFIYKNFNGEKQALISIKSTKISDYFKKHFSKNNLKIIPEWILSLPKEKLLLFLNELLNEDSGIITISKNEKQYKYTVSNQILSNQIQEMCFKVGEYSYIEKIYKNNFSFIYNIFRKTFSKNKNYFIKKNDISEIDYKGKVWCFEVPNHIFVIRNNGKIGIHGNSGKVLQLTKEYELIDKEIIKGLGVNEALLSGQGPSYCLDDKTRILTSNGLKYREELDISKDLIATFNNKRKSLEWQMASEKPEFNHNSIDGSDKDLYYFKNDGIDFVCTHNHRMLVSNNQNKWDTIEAEKVVNTMSFRTCIESWKGEKKSIEKILNTKSNGVNHLIETTIIEFNKKKSIPSWIKELPAKELSIFFNLIALKSFSNEKKNNSIIVEYESLKDDICEILLKLGYSVSFSLIKNFKLKKNNWFVQWSNNIIDKFPKITNKSITKIKYKGKVWCVVVPNSYIITERNGKFSIHGNSQAAIGIEATIKRLKNVQNLFAKWIIEYIYKPEAKMHNFYRETKGGGVELDVPGIRWGDLNLRDETQKQNQAISLWEKQAISTQTLLEKLGYDFDVEVERVRMEKQYQLQMGISPQDKEQGSGIGSGFGGGPLGGGASMGGGNLPGGQSGPGLPNDELAPSMSGGESSSGVPSGGSSMESNETQLKIKNYEDAKNTMPKVHRPKKFKLTKPKPFIQKQDSIETPELYKGRTGAVNLTSLEIKLYSAIEKGQNAGLLPLNFVWQQKPDPLRLPRIVVDGMFPDVKLVIQADGEQWHSSPKDIAKDQEINSRLSRLGWTVLRFTEQEINSNIESVLAKIIQTYKKMKKPKMF